MEDDKKTAASGSEDRAKILKEAEDSVKTPEDRKALKLFKNLLKMTEKEIKSLGE